MLLAFVIEGMAATPPIQIQDFGVALAERGLCYSPDERVFYVVEDWRHVLQNQANGIGDGIPKISQVSAPTNTVEFPSGHIGNESLRWCNGRFFLTASFHVSGIARDVYYSGIEWGLYTAPSIAELWDDTFIGFAGIPYFIYEADPSLFRDLCYGNNVYCGVGTGRTSTLIMRSADGLTWLDDATIQGPYPSYYNLNAVACGGGLFAAVGEGGKILVSSDAQSWLPRNLSRSYTDSLNGVCYGKGYFVAVGDFGQTITGFGESEWQVADPVPVSSKLNAVCFGGGQFVAVGANGTWLTSPDGRNWSAVNSGTTANIKDVCYGDGTFLAIGDSLLSPGNSLLLWWSTNKVVTVTASTGPGGTISPSGPITRYAGNIPVFTATPEPDYVVNQWLLNSNVVQIGGTTYTLSNLQTNKSLQVTFTYVPRECTITASADLGGTINPSGTFTKYSSESQVFTASPSTNYVVARWYVNLITKQIGGNSYTLSNIQADCSVRVTFTYAPQATPASLEARMDAGGPRITVAGAVGATYRIEARTDLAATSPWVPLINVVLPASPWIYIDYASAGSAKRFYRAVGMSPDTPAETNALSRMALIPAGSFTMGDAMGVGESPVHTVNVSAFYMDKFEVTSALWDEVWAWAVEHGYSFEHGAQGKASNHPAHSMTWFVAVKWCNARSEKEGLTPAYYTDAALSARYRSGQHAPYVSWNAGYRLPTEAEWEKAARGGANGLRFPWGNTISHQWANYFSSPSLVPYDLGPAGYHPAFATGGVPYTSPVGYFAANAYGLYDMAGNVSEWCWDFYSSTYYRSSPVTDPRGPSSGGSRVCRGGSWNPAAFQCRAAARVEAGPSGSSSGLGFRCVKAVGQ